MASRAFICGLRGTELSSDERAFLQDARPWGVILFKRNVDNPIQIRRLCAAAREALGREDAPVLIDQEGGRVQRIGPPHLRAYPAGAVYGRLYAMDPLLGVEAAHLGARLIALDLGDLGISIDCVPVLDVPVGRHDGRHRRPHARRKRRFGRDPRRRTGRRADARRAAAGDEAHARPWPRAGRQPQGAAARRRADLRAGRGGFRAFPAARAARCRSA